LYGTIRPTDAALTAAPGGSYLLLYPLMETGVPMEPARYYTASEVACWSWSLGTDGCVAVGELPQTWTRTRVLTPFAVQPTTLRALSHARSPYTVPSNGSVALELALLRTHRARPASRRACSWRLDAQWQGPEAAARPKSLCLQARGVSAGGLLFPLSPNVTQMLHWVS